MSDVKSTLTETLADHGAVWAHNIDMLVRCDCGYGHDIAGYDHDMHVDHQAEMILGLSGVAVTALPEPAKEDVDDDERPKQAGDYLKRGDTRSEVWIEGLPGSEPYVFFGRRGMGPSYMPAEYAQDVAAALLAASRAVVSEGETHPEAAK